MRILIFFSMLMCVIPAAALDYKVGVVFPYGESEPINKTLNTSKNQRTNKVELKNSKFNCETDVFDALGNGKVFSVRLKCSSEGSDQVFISSSSCADNVKISTGYEILVALHEGTKKREHQIFVECHPGKKSVVESALKSKK